MDAESFDIENVEAGEAEGVMPPPIMDDGMPHQDWIRGTCPECGLPLVSNMQYIPQRGTLVIWDCWGRMQEEPTCNYHRIL